MSRQSGFNSPFLLGFDHMEQLLDRASKCCAEGYPPYNIEQIGENGIRITVAVAGFSDDDLSVTLENNQLIIRGRQENAECQRMFIHRGIATRQFQRAFVLAEGIEVRGADLEKGLLNIDLERPVPETHVQTIKINSKDGGKKAQKTIDVTPEG